MTDFTNNMPMPVINIGADLFADALDAQSIAVTRVAWRPPAGDQHALRILLADPTVDAANKIERSRFGQGNGLCFIFGPAFIDAGSYDGSAHGTTHTLPVNRRPSMEQFAFS